MMKFLLDKRFNMLDATAIAIVAIYVSHGEWVSALVALVVGVSVALLAEHFLYNYKDSPWKFLADSGQKVAAVKEYRTIYGSTLTEALAAVDRYLGKSSR